MRLHAQARLYWQVVSKPDDCPINNITIMVRNGNGAADKA